MIKVACVSNHIPEINLIWRRWSSQQTDRRKEFIQYGIKKAEKCLKRLLCDDRNPHPSASTTPVNRSKKKKKRQGQTPRDHNDDVERRQHGHPHMGMIGVSPTTPQSEAPREQTQMANVPRMYLQCCGGKLLTRCRPGLDPHREDDGRSDDVSQSQPSGAAPSSWDVLCVRGSTCTNSWCWWQNGLLTCSAWFSGQTAPPFTSRAFILLN